MAFNSSCQYAKGTTWRDVTPIPLFRTLTRVKHVSGNCCRQRETPQINSLAARDAVPKVFSSDVFENVVYYLDLSHHGHFHAPVSSAGKLNTGLEFLNGTQWRYHRRHVAEHIPKIARFCFLSYRRYRTQEIRMSSRRL